MTGLSKDVIRVWERRYGLVKPVRGANRYRQYTDEDVSLLRYIKEEMEKGESIGGLAEFGREELLARMRAAPSPAPSSISPYERLLGELTQALDPLDRITFERKLNGAVAIIPFEEALHGILLPLQQRVGRLWHDGVIGIAVEHYVTKHVQQKMFAVMNQMPFVEQGPKVVVACPDGEVHEIGALTVAYRCRVRGCRVYYLGASVPIGSLARFCADVRPDLLLLSVPIELPPGRGAALARELAEEVQPSCKIAAGGYGALAIRDLFEHVDIDVLAGFPDLDDRLARMVAYQNSAER